MTVLVMMNKETNLNDKWYRELCWNWMEGKRKVGWVYEWSFSIVHIVHIWLALTEARAFEKNYSII